MNRTGIAGSVRSRSVDEESSRAASDAAMVNADVHFLDPTKHYYPWLCGRPMIPFHYGDYSAICRPYYSADHLADARPRAQCRHGGLSRGRVGPRDQIGEIDFIAQLRRDTRFPAPSQTRERTIIMLLPDKVAIITGAASVRGIGRATAKRFAEHGAAVAVVDLDANASAAAAREIGPKHRGYGCDVADPAHCQKLVKQVIADFGKLDILVNYAGVSQPDRIMEVTQERYDLVMNVNVRGTMNMCQAAIPHFRSRRTGNIICVGSVAAQRGGGLFGGPHYSASKGAVQSMAKSMARELGPDGIRVNAIAPGTIDTDIFQGKLTDEKKKAIAAEVPLGRLGTADDVATACLFLVSDLAGYITGSVLDVNGGLLIHH